MFYLNIFEKYDMTFNRLKQFDQNGVLHLALHANPRGSWKLVHSAG